MMKIHQYAKRILLAFLFAFVLGAAPHTAFAMEQPAPALPQSGLPDVPIYSETASGFPLSKGILPSRYDAREHGYVTSVKNQDPWGACWAFGTLSAGESNMIKKGISDTSLDLSEMHLAYFFYQCPVDPLRLTDGDTLHNNTGQYFLDTGGNNLFTMFALSKWVGAAPENLVPYSNHTSIPAAYAYQDAAHMQNARFVNTADKTSVKNLILEYGAVSSAIFYHPAFQSPNGAYFFPYVDEYPSNHIVSIIGWDDNYSRDHFKVTYQGKPIRPSRNGAWIVKNSYGTDSGEQGYLYISYEDASVVQAKGDFLSYAFDMESADNYDHNYQYDGSFGSGMTTSMNGTSLANVYKVQGNPGGNEQLSAVSFSVFSQNVRYSIQVYKNPGAGDPTSGSPIFSSPQTGYTTYSGYYTIPLNSKPVFRQGDTFSVVITLSAASSSSVSYFLDQTLSVSDLHFISKSAKNQSYYKSDVSGGWIDLHSAASGKTARIKAFTTNTTLPATKVELYTSSLKAPRITSLKQTGSRKVSLKWKTVKHAEKYIIYRSEGKHGSYQKIAATKKTSFTDSKRTPGATYSYKIRACRTLNKQPAYGKYSSVKQISLKPAAPKLLSVRSSGKRDIKLKWKKVQNAKGYEVFCSTSKKSGFKKVKSLKKTTYVHKNAKKKYQYYKVRCYNTTKRKKFYSEFSNTVSCK